LSFVDSKRTHKPSRHQVIQAALSFDSAPLEVIVGGGAFCVAALGYLAIEAMKEMKQQEPDVENYRVNKAVIPRENAVLVYGATGRSGRQIVAQV